MTKDEIMRDAIELSRREMRGGNAAPFAAVIVRDSDPAAHGEVDAIRDACRKLGTWQACAGRPAKGHRSRRSTLSSPFRA
jgi:tRNA(Arg) A34 adenosine deaminase TadA